MDSVQTDTERETLEKDSPPIAVVGNEEEEAPADMVASDHEEQSERKTVTEESSVEEAAVCEPEDNSGNELPGDSSITTTEDLDVKVNEVNEQPLSHEESVIFEINSSYDDGAPRLHLETPERETATRSPQEAEEEEEEEEEAADLRYEEYKQLLQELCEQRDEAGRHGSRLQVRLVDYFGKRDDANVEMEVPGTQQLQEYKECMNLLTELKQQLSAESETARQWQEELRIQAHEKLDKVEGEWRGLLAQKQDTAVALLSRRLGKEAAQAKVESVLTVEQRRQDELIKLRLKNIKLKIKICRMEAELLDRDQQHKDPMYIEFERLQAEKLLQRNQAEKQREVALKLQKKTSSCLELLSNVKEKLQWTQTEVQVKREQLAKLEAAVATKRDLLTRTKQTRNSLQRDNLRLKERGGLLGNKALLRDFEDTVDASDLLEERLENLRCRQAEIVFSGGR